MTYYEKKIAEFVDFLKINESENWSNRDLLPSIALEWIQSTGANAGKKLLGEKASIHNVYEFSGDANKKMMDDLRKDFFSGVDMNEYDSGKICGWRSFNLVYDYSLYIPVDSSESFRKGFLNGWNTKHSEVM